MRKEKKIKIGISIGDLNGIGGELIVRTFSDNRLLEFCTPVVFASTKIMSFLKKHFQSSISIHGINDASHAVDGKLNVVNVWQLYYLVSYLLFSQFRHLTFLYLCLTR